MLELRGPILPERFGEDWLTSPAADMVRIAVTIAGYPAKDLTQRLAMKPHRGERLNVTSVLNAMYEIDAADPDHAPK